MDYKTWSRHEAVPLSNGLVTRRTGFGYLKPPEEISAYYREHFGIYWFNELPKTDNVYSPSSQYYGCTLAPGIPLIPNLCRRPLRSGGDGGYDYTTTRITRSSYAAHSESEEDDWMERNNTVNRLLDNGHSGHNNSHLTSLNLDLPLPRRRIEFNDSGLDSDSEYDGVDNHSGHVKAQSRSHNHVTWFSWIITVLTTIVTMVVTTVTETLHLRNDKHHNHVETRVPLKQSSATAASWYQRPVLWLYKAALAVHRADTWLLYKVNSVLRVEGWADPQRRRRLALVLLLIPILVWAAWTLYDWSSGDALSVASSSAWLLSPLLLAWDVVCGLAAGAVSWISAGFGWFDGSWVSYPWIVLAGWWESSGDHSATEETITSETTDWTWLTSWLLWPFDSLSVLAASAGGCLASGASVLGEAAIVTYSAVTSSLSAVLLWIVTFVTGIPTAAASAFALLLSPLKSISWPASPPTPDYTPSAPPDYTPSAPPYEHYQHTSSAASAANWDHLLADQQMLAVVVRRLLSTAEFQHALAEKQSLERSSVEAAFSATLDSKMEALKQQIQDLQTALRNLVSEQSVLGDTLEEKLSSEQLKIKDQVIPSLREQILLEVEKVNERIMNLQVNQKVLPEASTDIPPVSQSPELEAFINTTVERLLAIYDADKIAKVDYALASSGGSVLSVRCTETFSLKNAQYNLWGYPLWSKAGNDPKVALEPGIVAGQCWAFAGSQGYLIVELSQNVTVTGFTLEHLPRSLSPSGTIDTAPRDFRVLGLESEQDDMPILLGSFTYEDNGKSLQYFDALEVDHAFKIVELVIESNHGNLEYTCLYRFRVHGRPIPSP